MSTEELEVWLEAGTVRRGLIWMSANNRSEAAPPSFALGLLAGLDPCQPSVAWSDTIDGSTVVAAGFRSWRRRQVSGQAFWRLAARGGPHSRATRLLASNLLRDVTDELNAKGARPESAAELIDRALVDYDAMSFSIADPALADRLASLGPTLGSGVATSRETNYVSDTAGNQCEPASPDFSKYHDAAKTPLNSYGGVRYGINDTERRRALQYFLEVAELDPTVTVAATFMPRPVALCRPGSWILTPQGRPVEEATTQSHTRHGRGTAIQGDESSYVAPSGLEWPDLLRPAGDWLARKARELSNLRDASRKRIDTEDQ